MMVTLVVVALVLCSFLEGQGHAFSIQRSSYAFNRITKIIPRTTSTRLHSSSKEEEIKKLEEQLRRLKEETEQEEPAGSNETSFAKVAATVGSSDEYVGRGPAKRPVQPMEEMMSEAWKAGDDPSQASESGGALTTVAAALALVLFLGLFSQIPVGQEDLSKYQAVKTSTQIDLGDLNPVRSSDI